MFSSSIALISTQDKNWFSHMRALMRQAGFKETRPFPKSPAILTQFRHGPLPFVFIDSGIAPADIKRSFAAVRAHADVNIRFLPIVVLTESRDANSILRFIELGCDDIVTMPLTAASLIERLKRQVGSPRDYFQTDTYFGPDRRQHDFSHSKTHEDRGKGDHFFRHFSIQRHLQHGISIIDTAVHYPNSEQVILPV